MHRPPALLNGLIGSIRRECADHIIVLGEAHLRQIDACVEEIVTDNTLDNTLTMQSCMTFRKPMAGGLIEWQAEAK